MPQKTQTRLVLAAIAALCGLGATPAGAEVVRLQVGAPLARMALLKAGVHRYVRYTIAPDGGRNAIDIWARTVGFGPHDGDPAALHVVQRWDEVSKAVLRQDSWFDRRSFAPTTHVRRLERDGKTTVAGYRFTPGKVVGLPDLPDNSRRDFAMAMPEPAYNFEYDMELLQTLPLAAGRTFDIPFYDAGIDPKPDRYRFAVAGSDRIAGADGRPVDCWLVTADYHTGKVVSRFWFAKAGQLLVREEQAQKDGSTLVKALLPPESADG